MNNLHGVSEQTLQPAPATGILLHRDGLVFDADEQTAAMFGYRRAELLKKPLATLIIVDGLESSNGDGGTAGEAATVLGVKKDGSTFKLEIVVGTTEPASR